MEEAFNQRINQMNILNMTEMSDMNMTRAVGQSYTKLNETMTIVEHASKMKLATDGH